MNGQKIFWASNIRHLRIRKRLSQDGLADQLGISRSKLSAHENGQTQNPVVGDLIGFSHYFGISIDTLLKVDLTRLSELKIRELEAGNDAYATGSHMRVLAITADKDSQENMEYVPVKAKAGYQSGYSDPEYIASLPRFSLPNLPKGKTFRMFPTQGDSMLPVPEGADVIAEFVQDWTALKEQTPCVIILREAQDFLFKLASYQKEAGVFLLCSLNEMYAPYTVPVADILEIWKCHRYQTGNFPEPETPLQQLRGMVRDLHLEVRRLKEK